MVGMALLAMKSLMHLRLWRVTRDDGVDLVVLQPAPDPAPAFGSNC